MEIVSNSEFRIPNFRRQAAVLLPQSPLTVKPRPFLLLRALTILVAAAATGSPTHGADAPADPAPRPNFLVIVADDLCWRDLGYQGHPDVKTPHLDRLAADGLRLDGFFSPAATCSPLRHCLYTGLYPVRSGAFPNHTRVYDGTRSLFGYLKDLGYRVALQNKTHVGPPASFPFEHLAGADDLAPTEAFLRRQPGQPWLLAYCSNDPHSPWDRGPAYDPATLTVPPHLHDDPTTRKLLAAYYGEISQLDHQVGALMKLLDETGQADRTLVLFLSEQGCSLPFGGKWSLYDTGVRVAAIARWPGVIPAGGRSAALIQCVDVAPTFIELAGGDPTRLDTGCPDAHGGRGFDGRSFASVLRGETASFRDHVFAQHTTVGVNGFLEPYPSRMARDSRYKLIRNLAPANTFTIGGIHRGQPLESWQGDAQRDPALAARIRWLFRRPGEELYDLETDPFEQKNLAADPAFAAIKARLQDRLDAWMAQQGDRGLETEMLAPTRQGKSDEDGRPKGAKGKGKRKSKASAAKKAA